MIDIPTRRFTETILKRTLSPAEAANILDVPESILKAMKTTEHGPKPKTDKNGDTFYEYRDLAAWQFIRNIKHSDYAEYYDDAILHPVHSEGGTSQ